MTSYQTLTNVRRRGMVLIRLIDNSFLTQSCNWRSPLLCNELCSSYILLFIWAISLSPSKKLYHHFVATTSKDFDTTLMICILRSLNFIPPPSSGWDTLPPEFENTLGANLTIIKVYRNKLCHTSKARINDKTFRKMKSSLIHVRFTL